MTFSGKAIRVSESIGSALTRRDRGVDGEVSCSIFTRFRGVFGDIVGVDMGSLGSVFTGVVVVLRVERRRETKPMSVALGTNEGIAKLLEGFWLSEMVELDFLNLGIEFFKVEGTTTSSSEGL